MSTSPGLARTSLRRFLDYAVLSVLAFIFALPVLYLLLGSLKPSDEVLNGLSGFLPTHLSFDNYSAVLSNLNSDSTGYFWRFMGVSLLLAFVVVTGGLFVNSMAAYGLSRLKWRGQATRSASRLISGRRCTGQPHCAGRPQGSPGRRWTSRCAAYWRRSPVSPTEIAPPTRR